MRETHFVHYFTDAHPVDAAFDEEARSCLNDALAGLFALSIPRRHRSSSLLPAEHPTLFVSVAHCLAGKGGLSLNSSNRLAKDRRHHVYAAILRSSMMSSSLLNGLGLA